MIPIIILVDKSLMQKLKNSSSPQKKHDNDDPHMEGTPQFSLQSFSLFQQMVINTILQ